MDQLRNATLLFLIKRDGGIINDILLAQKKRGFGLGRYNGVGGKVKPGETIEEAAKRETQEEIGVKVDKIIKVAELSFYFPHQPDWNQMVHTYFVEEWAGEPTESEEMNPKWFAAASLPFAQMWPDDIFWVPDVISGKLLRARFTFGEGDAVLEKDIIVVEGF